MRNPFRYFNSSPEVIRLAVMMYIRYPGEHKAIVDEALWDEVQRKLVANRVDRAIGAEAAHLR